MKREGTGDGRGSRGVLGVLGVCSLMVLAQGDGKLDKAIGCTSKFRLVLRTGFVLCLYLSYF